MFWCVGVRVRAHARVRVRVRALYEQVRACVHVCAPSSVHPCVRHACILLACALTTSVWDKCVCRSHLGDLRTRADDGNESHRTLCYTRK